MREGGTSNEEDENKHDYFDGNVKDNKVENVKHCAEVGEECRGVMLVHNNGLYLSLETLRGILCKNKCVNFETSYLDLQGASTSFSRVLDEGKRKILEE